MLTTKVTRQKHTLKIHVPRPVRDHMRLVAGDFLIWSPLPNGAFQLDNASHVLRDHLKEPPST